jgi:RNA polymerase sigma-70 factor (ECF subfamily)
LTYWLRRTITNKCIDHARWRQHHEHAALEQVAEPGVAPAVLDPYLSEALRKGVQSLPATKRLVVILRFQEEMELAEIAEVMRMPVNTVKSTLHRALALLREKVCGWEAAKEHGTARK